jgi:hypothetical protein
MNSVLSRILHCNKGLKTYYKMISWKMILATIAVIVVIRMASAAPEPKPQIIG